MGVCHASQLPRELLEAVAEVGGEEVRVRMYGVSGEWRGAVRAVDGVMRERADGLLWAQAARAALGGTRLGRVVYVDLEGGGLMSVAPAPGGSWRVQAGQEGEVACEGTEGRVWAWMRCAGVRTMRLRLFTEEREGFRGREVWELDAAGGRRVCASWDDGIYHNVWDSCGGCGCGG